MTHSKPDYISTIELSAQDQACSGECPHCPNWDRGEKSSINELHPDAEESFKAAQNTLRHTQREPIHLVLLNNINDFTESARIPDIDPSILYAITIFLRSSESDWASIASRIQSLFTHVHGEQENSVSLGFSQNITYQTLTENLQSSLEDGVQNLVKISEEASANISFLRPNDFYLQCLSHHLLPDQLNAIFEKRNYFSQILSHTADKLAVKQFDPHDVDRESRQECAMRLKRLAFRERAINCDKKFEILLRTVSNSLLNDEEIINRFIYEPSFLSFHPKGVMINHTTNTVNDKRLWLAHEEFRAAAGLSLQEGIGLKSTLALILSPRFDDRIMQCLEEAQ